MNRRSIPAAIAPSACTLLAAHAQNLYRQNVEDYIQQSELDGPKPQ